MRVKILLFRSASLLYSTKFSIRFIFQILNSHFVAILIHKSIIFKASKAKIELNKDEESELAYQTKYVKYSKFEKLKKIVF